MADTPSKEISSAGPIHHHGNRQIEIIGPNGERQKVSADELTQADTELAARFGYKPVFKREFGYLSTFSFAVSISGVFATIMTTLYYPLVAGGSSAIVWCWLISGAGCMCIAVSVLSENRRLGSADSPDSARLLSWSLLTRPLVVCTLRSLAWPHQTGFLRSVGKNGPPMSLNGTTRS